MEGWWTWGSLEGELKRKKFARWERPDREGEIGNLMPGEKTPDVEGYVEWDTSYYHGSARQ